MTDTSTNECSFSETTSLTSHVSHSESVLTLLPWLSAVNDTISASTVCCHVGSAVFTVLVVNGKVKANVTINDAVFAVKSSSGGASSLEQLLPQILNSASLSVDTTRFSLVTLILGTVTAYQPAIAEELSFTLKASAMVNGLAPVNAVVLRFTSSMKAVPTAQVVVISVVSTVTAMGGATSQQLFGLLGLMSCSTGREQHLVSGMNIPESPIRLGHGALGQLTGGVTLLFCVIATHVVVVYLLRSLPYIESATYAVRFPALSLVMALFLCNGLAYSSVNLLWSDERWWVRGLACVTFVATLCIPFYAFHTIRRVLPKMDYCRFDWYDGSSFITKAFVPTGCWGPELYFGEYGMVLGEMRGGYAYHALLPFVCALLMGAVAGVQPGAGTKKCVVQKGMVISIACVQLLWVVLVRPFRRFMSNVLSTCSCVAVVAAFTASATGNTWLLQYAVLGGTVLSTVQLLYDIVTAIADWIWWRPAVWPSVETLADGVANVLKNRKVGGSGAVTKDTMLIAMLEAESVLGEVELSRLPTCAPAVSDDGCTELTEFAQSPLLDLGYWGKDIHATSAEDDDDEGLLRKFMMMI